MEKHATGSQHSRTYREEGERGPTPLRKRPTQEPYTYEAHGKGNGT